MVEEAPRVPEDAGRRQAGTLRHHRLLEVRPAKQGHVPRRRPHGGRRGPPHQPPSRHGRHRHEDLRSHGRSRQDRAGQLQGALFHGQARHRQAGPHPHQQCPLRLPDRRGRQAGGRRSRGRGSAPRLQDVRPRWEGSARHHPAAERRRRAVGEGGQAVVRRYGPSHPEQRDLQGNVVVRQGALRLHRGGHPGLRTAGRRMDSGPVPASRG